MTKLTKFISDLLTMMILALFR